MRLSFRTSLRPDRADSSTREDSIEFRQWVPAGPGMSPTVP